VKVSVVVCTYTLDMYEHFREAADSVLAQTHDDVELVVIVDGTPEVYEQVVDDYGDREDVVIKCNDENVGLLESRNRGAAIASGDVSRLSTTTRSPTRRGSSGWSAPMKRRTRSRPAGR